MDEGVPNDTLTTGKLRRSLSDTDCVACPVEVRDLYATAHNAVQAADAARAGRGEWLRFYRKLEELRTSVAKMKPVVEAHFADRGHAKISRT